MEETPQGKIIARLSTENAELKNVYLMLDNVLWSLNKNCMIGFIKFRSKVIIN